VEQELPTSLGYRSGAGTTYFSGVPEWSRNYLLLWSIGVEQELPTSLEYRSASLVISKILVTQTLFLFVLFF
jgi:hypothetical protein